jgi:hypothetical protein
MFTAVNHDSLSYFEDKMARLTDEIVVERDVLEAGGTREDADALTDLGLVLRTFENTIAGMAYATEVLAHQAHRDHG